MRLEKSSETDGLLADVLPHDVATAGADIFCLVQKIYLSVAINHFHIWRDATSARVGGRPVVACGLGWTGSLVSHRPAYHSTLTMVWRQALLV